MTLIGTTEEFKQECSYPLSIHNKSVLLIHQQQKYYLIENKCGHFGIALNDATIKDEQIICSQHAISFSLNSGQVVNRPYENCDSIKIFKLEKVNDDLYSPDL